MHVCMCVCMYAFMCVYVCVYMIVCVCVCLIHTYISLILYMYIYIERGAPAAQERGRVCRRARGPPFSAPVFEKKKVSRASKILNRNGLGWLRTIYDTETSNAN